MRDHFRRLGDRGPIKITSVCFCLIMTDLRSIKLHKLHKLHSASFNPRFYELILKQNSSNSILKGIHNLACFYEE